MAPETNIESEHEFMDQPLRVGALQRLKIRRREQCIVRVTEQSPLREADDVIKGTIRRRLRGPEIMEVSVRSLRRFDRQAELYDGLECSARDAGMAALRIQWVESPDTGQLLERGYFPLKEDASLWEKPLVPIGDIDKDIATA